MGKSINGALRDGFPSKTALSWVDTKATADDGEGTIDEKIHDRESLRFWVVKTIFHQWLDGKNTLVESLRFWVKKKHQGFKRRFMIYFPSTNPVVKEMFPQLSGWSSA